MTFNKKIRIHLIKMYVKKIPCHTVVIYLGYMPPVPQTDECPVGADRQAAPPLPKAIHKVRGQGHTQL